MKVLQINKFLKIVGGAETYMFQLSNALQDIGIEVRFWGMEDGNNIVNDFPGLETENVDFTNQGLLRKFSSVFETVYSKNNKRKIAEVLDIYQPDIVHIHNYNFQITPSILPEIKRRGIKIVQTIHDSQMVCPYHRLYNFQRNEVCTKCVTGSFVNCIKDRCFDGSIFKSTVGAMESMFYHSQGYYKKYVDTFISPSDFLANLIKHRITNRIEVIPNFTKVQPNHAMDETANDYYLYYGRISDEKGVLELIEIFKDTKLNLTIVGKGPIEHLVIDKINNIENIKCRGAKYGEELFSIVRMAKYVVQPSKWFENCPMTIIESFALGVPVIGSNHSGFKDLIINGKTGHLLDFNDKKGAVTKLLDYDMLDIAEFKKHVSASYANNFSERDHLEKILKVYKTLLQ